VVTTPLFEEEAQLPGGTQPEAGMHRSVLLAQLDQKLRSAPKAVAERDRALFWLYYMQGFTAEEIARLTATGLTAKGVESALRRVTTWLRGEIERQKSEESLESG